MLLPSYEGLCSM